MSRKTAIWAAVDGGASNTRVRLTEPDGRELGTGKAGPSSLTLGVSAAWKQISNAMDAAAKEAGIALDGSLQIAIAVAGALNPAQRAAFRAANPYTAELMLMTDGYAALLGAFDGQPGTTLAVGTGVTAFSRNPDGTTRSVSGWGWPIGDEGGGVWIGHRAMALYTHHLDGRHTDGSSLFAALHAASGGGLYALQDWLLHADATAYASLAPLVVAAADAGDLLADSVLQDAARHLEHALAALESGDSDGTPIAVLGGLGSTMVPRFPEYFRRRLIPPKGGILDGTRRVLEGLDAPEFDP